MPFMVDLFSGLGGAHAAMRDRGWRVLTVDIEPWLKPDVIADVAHLPIAPRNVDLLWASPPCTEYSRKSMPCWFKDAPDPDLTLWRAAEAAIQEIQPRYWVIENVRGAVPYHGRPTFRFQSRHLWTNIPMLSQPGAFPTKYRMSVERGRKSYWLRSRVEYNVSLAVAAAVEGLL